MKRRWRWILLMSLLLIIPTQAFADSPPPPAEADYILHVTHAPGEAYCVGILTHEKSTTIDVLSGAALPSQRKMVEALFSLEAEGWYPLGDLPEDGLIRAAGSDTVKWMTLSQKLQEYRLIYVSQSGNVQVSEPIVRRDYTNLASYDVSTNQLTQSIDYWEYGKRLLIAVGVTLLIEMLLLKPLGFSLKQNWRVVTVTNLATQLLLNGTLFVTHYFEFTSQDWSVLLWLEIAIVVIEAVVYALLFKEKTVLRRVLYALLANVASLWAGMIVYAFTMGLTSGLWALFMPIFLLQLVFLRLY